MHTSLFRPMLKGALLKSALLATAATLALGACKDKSAAGDVEAVEALSVKGLSDADIAKHFEVGTCAATDAQMQAGLAALGLSAPSDGMAWASREMEDGGYEFDGMTLTGDEGETVTIDELDLTCLREVDGVVMVDRVSAEGVTVTSPEATMTIASLTAVEPDVETLGRLLDGDDDLDVPDARAFAVNDLKVVMSGAESGTITLESFAFADAMNGGQDGFVRMGEFDFDGEDDGQIIDIEFEGATITGMASLDDLTDSAGGMASMSTKAMGPFGMAFETMDIGAFDAKVDTLQLSGNGITGQNTGRGGKMKMVSVVEPITLRFNGEPTSGDIRPLYDALTGMGYDDVTISARSEGSYDEAADRMVSEGGFFELKDGFRLEIDSDVTGMKAMSMAAQQGGDPTAALGDMRFGGLTVRLDDNSIVERIFTAVAAEQGTTAKMLRMQAKGLLAMGSMSGAGMGIDPEVTSDLVSALGEFLDNPDSTLVISLDPANPVGMEQLMSLSKAESGFSATVEK